MSASIDLTVPQTRASRKRTTIDLTVSDDEDERGQFSPSRAPLSSRSLSSTQRTRSNRGERRRRPTEPSPSASTNNNTSNVSRISPAYSIAPSPTSSRTTVSITITAISTLDIRPISTTDTSRRASRDSSTPPRRRTDQRATQGPPNRRSTPSETRIPVNSPLDIRPISSLPSTRTTRTPTNHSSRRTTPPSTPPTSRRRRSDSYQLALPASIHCISSRTGRGGCGRYGVVM